MPRPACDLGPQSSKRTIRGTQSNDEYRGGGPHTTLVMECRARCSDRHTTPRGLRARHRAVIIYGEQIMLVTIAIILLVLWLLGVVVVPVGSSLIHGLLVVALVLFIWQFVGGRRGSL